MADADVGDGSVAAAASVAPTIPRLDLSSLVDGPRPSPAQIAMKNALEGHIGGAGNDVGETSTTPEMLPIGAVAEEPPQGPSTPTSARAAHASVEIDVCTICTGTLGENGGTLSLLCGTMKGLFFLGEKKQLGADHLSQPRWFFFSLSSFPVAFPSLTFSPPSTRSQKNNKIRPPLLLPLHPPLAQAVPPLPELPRARRPRPRLGRRRGAALSRALAARAVGRGRAGRAGDAGGGREGGPLCGAAAAEPEGGRGRGGRRRGRRRRRRK